MHLARQHAPAPGPVPCNRIRRCAVRGLGKTLLLGKQGGALPRRDRSYPVTLQVRDARQRRPADAWGVFFLDDLHRLVRALRDDKVRWRRASADQLSD